MRRKEQEARIEQQRQEKEKAREDAARERARYVNSDPFSMDARIQYRCLLCSSFQFSCHFDEWETDIYTVISHCFSVSRLKRPRGASGCS